jgi:hypothetical protein
LQSLLNPRLYIEKITDSHDCLPRTSRPQPTLQSNEERELARSPASNHATWPGRAPTSKGAGQGADHHASTRGQGADHHGSTPGRRPQIDQAWAPPTNRQGQGAAQVRRTELIAARVEGAAHKSTRPGRRPAPPAGAHRRSRRGCRPQIDQARASSSSGGRSASPTIVAGCAVSQGSPTILAICAGSTAILAVCAGSTAIFAVCAASAGSSHCQHRSRFPPPPLPSPLSSVLLFYCSVLTLFD